MKKISQERAEEEVLKRGFSLLSTYGAGKKLSLRCSQGHNFSVSWSNLKHRNSGCPTCKANNIAVRCKVPYGFLVSKASAANVTILTKETEYYENHKKSLKIKIRCSCGNELLVSSARIQKFVGCIKCRSKRFSSKLRYSNEEAADLVKKAGYVLLSKYINSKELMIVLCSKHGEFKIRLNDLNEGHGCRRCGSFGSAGETEVFDFIKQLASDVVKNDRSAIAPKELDTYVPSKKLAVEYCGLYWHAEDKRGKDHISKKHKECKERGITLLTIFEDEWEERKEQVKMMIARRLGHAVKLNARDCEVRHVPTKEAVAFLNQHHLQGSCPFLAAFGLYHPEHGLVEVLTLGRHHRGLRGQVVLNRLCSGPHLVRGGASKLVSAAVRYSLKAGYSKIVSWSDNRWSSGDVYEKVGFVLEEELPPDYSYVVAGKVVRKSKQSCKKSELLKLGAVGKTELEMASSLGLVRIWDAGKKRWAINLSC